MKSSQIILNNVGDNSALEELKDLSPQLVIAFGSTNYFTNDTAKAVTAAAPNAIVIGCSTAGEISDDGVDDETLVLTGVQFDKYKEGDFKPAIASIDQGSEAAGKSIAETLNSPDLKAVFVLSQGVNVNGTELIQGMDSILKPEVLISGGLAGDGGKFEKTYTMLNGEAHTDKIVAFGLYSGEISFAAAAYGGWEPFGPERTVTKANKNVLYELDGKPALEVYKSYLGEHAKDLPESGLLFPFAIVGDNGDFELIRTILAVDEEAGSLTLAGDVPVNGKLKLMHSENDALVDGAEKAANDVSTDNGSVSILISCVGRKLVMGDEVEEEVDKVKEVLNPLHVTGFYSYGEIAPLKREVLKCHLHNQTMTITTIKEAA